MQVYCIKPCELCVYWVVDGTYSNGNCNSNMVGSLSKTRSYNTHFWIFSVAPTSFRRLSTNTVSGPLICPDSMGIGGFVSGNTER